MKNIVMRVECLVRSEFTVPGWTEFTVMLVSVKTEIYFTVADACPLPLKIELLENIFACIEIELKYKVPLCSLFQFPKKI